MRYQMQINPIIEPNLEIANTGTHGCAIKYSHCTNVHMCIHRSKFVYVFFYLFISIYPMRLLALANFLKKRKSPQKPREQLYGR